MSKDSKQTAINLSEMKQFFGPPPVLSTEDSAAYDRLMTELVSCLKPRDFIEKMLLKDIANEEWDNRRLARHKLLAVERKFRQHREFQIKRQELTAQRKQQQTEDIRARTEMKENGKAEEYRKFELESIRSDAVPELDDLLKQAADERDHVIALEGSLQYTERLNAMQTTAIEVVPLPGTAG